MLIITCITNAVKAEVKITVGVTNMAILTKYYWFWNENERELYGIKLELRKRRDELSLQELNCVLKKKWAIFAFDFVYLQQILVNFQNKGQFLNPQNMQIPKLSQIFKIDQDLLEISLVTGSNYNIAQFSELR